MGTILEICLGIAAVNMAWNLYKQNWNEVKNLCRWSGIGVCVWVLLHVLGGLPFAAAAAALYWLSTGDHFLILWPLWLVLFMLAIIVAAAVCEVKWPVKWPEE